MQFLLDAWYLYVRLLRATIRVPAFLVMSIVQPVMWVVLFGQLFRSVAEMPGFEGGSYVQYLAPGIAVVTALFGAAYTGLGLLTEMDSGFLARLLATPVSRAAIITSRVGVGATQVAVQATVILLITALLGARPQGGVPGLVLVYLGTCLLAGAASAFSCGLALLARRQEVILAITNLLLLPVIYISSTLMSSRLMPDWMRIAAYFNPVDWAVGIARVGFEGGYLPSALWRLGLLTAFTLLCATFAVRAFRRYRRSF